MSNTNIPFYLDYCIKNAGKMATGKLVIGGKDFKGRIVAYRNRNGVEQIGLEIPDGEQKKFATNPPPGATYFQEDGWFNVVFDRKTLKACSATSVRLVGEDNGSSDVKQYEAAPAQEELKVEAAVPRAACGHKYCSSFCHLRYAGLI